MILIAGIGNIFLGDDGFGSEVARQLSRRVLNPSVRVIDFGIRGMDLLYTLLDQYDATIIVDALPQQGKPGTLYVFEPDLSEPEQQVAALEAHAMDPLAVLLAGAFHGGGAEEHSNCRLRAGNLRPAGRGIDGFESRCGCRCRTGRRPGRTVSRRIEEHKTEWTGSRKVAPVKVLNVNVVDAM